VYQRALAFFTPEDIAEAFAAARGIASPTQLRTVMKQDGRDLVAQFRALAPERRPISLQRWSLRRILLVAGLALGAVVCAFGVYGMFTPAELPVGDQPACGTSDVMILMAQSVPTATAVPCVASVPAGWNTRDVTVVRNRARFRLRSGDNVVEVQLRPPGDCAVQGADEIPSDELGMRRFERPAQLPPGARTTRIYLSPGACVTYELDLADSADTSMVVQLDAALAFQPRAELAAEVQRRTGLRLCGAGVPPCVGGEP
jgi:hypothetical protein